MLNNDVKINSSIKKVCMLAYTFYETDGRVKRYAETLVKRGILVDVISLRRENQSYSDVVNGVNVYRIQRRTYNERVKLTYLLRVVLFLIKSFFVLSLKHLKNPYQIVHVHSVPDFEVFSALIPKLCGAKVILDIHDIVPEFYISKFGVSKEALIYKLLMLVERISIAFSDHVIIANGIWRKTLLSRSVREEKCTAILNYPDLTIFYRRAHKKNRNDNKFVIMYPGSFNYHQGLDIAIKAVALIKNEFPNVELHLYGDAGQNRKSLMELVAELHIEKTVLFNDRISNIADKMADADLGVVPKRADTFGNEAFSTKILEFMALGVPVVAANTKVERFYFNESLIKMFKSGDEKDLAENILLIIKDKKLRDSLLENSSLYINENNWGVKENIYINIINSLFKKSTS